MNWAFRNCVYQIERFRAPTGECVLWGPVVRDAWGDCMNWEWREIAADFRRPSGAGSSFGVRLPTQKRGLTSVALPAVGQAGSEWSANPPPTIALSNAPGGNSVTV